MKFKTFLKEASLNSKSLTKDATRLQNFVNKFANEEPYTTTKGKEVVLKKSDEVLAQIEAGDIPKTFELKDGGTIKLSELEKTSEFGGQGSKSVKQPSGAQWESLITYAWNKEDKIELADKKAVETFWGTQYSDIAKEISKNLRKKVKTKGDMQQFGTGGGTKISLSNYWRGSNKTPKTDMLVGNTRISLKKAGGSQVMSAKKDEAMSTFEAAIGFVGAKQSKKVKELVTILKEGMSETIKISSDIRNIKKKAKEDLKGTDFTVIKFDEFHANAKKEVRQFFMAKENSIFKEYFTYEAASGETKFGNGTQPVANYMVTFDAGSGAVEVEYIGEDAKPSDSIIKLSQKVTFDVNFKSSGGTTYSALRVMKQEAKKNKKVTVKESTENVLPTFADLYEETMKEHEAYLTEGIFDGIKNFFSSLMKKVSSALGKIYNLGKKAFHALLAFFGLEISDVSAKGPSFLWD